MFRDRTRLHKHGYQHKVVKIFDRMLLDALLAADDALKLSEAHEDPERFMRMKDVQVIKLSFNHLMNNNVMR